MALWQDRYGCVLSACNVTWTPAGKNIVPDSPANDKEAKSSGDRNPFFFFFFFLSFFFFFFFHENNSSSGKYNYFSVRKT